MIFLVFTKNEALLGLLGITLPYNQLIIYILTTLCAISMPLESKLWRSQWFEVGQSAMEKLIYGQIWLLDHERSPAQLSVSYAILFSIQNYILEHIFWEIEVYLRTFKFQANLSRLDDHSNLKNLKYSPIALKMCPIT